MTAALVRLRDRSRQTLETLRLFVAARWPQICLVIVVTGLVLAFALRQKGIYLMAIGAVAGLYEWWTSKRES